MRSGKHSLSIEVTGPYLGLALHEFDGDGNVRLVGLCFEEKHHGQSDLLFPALDRMFRKARLKKNDLSLVCSDVGPGSFTGVRMGIAVARGVAQALRLPVVGVTSLEAMAWKKPALKRGESKTIIACFPALTGELYYAVYRKTMKERPALVPIVQPVWRDHAQFRSFLKGWNAKKATPVHVVGTNAGTLKPLASSFAWVRWEKTNVPPHPAAIGEIGIHRYLAGKQKEAFHYENLAPLYLQPSWAERRKPMPA